MFKKVLIANRGAIACRIIRTLRAMNIASVAVYAEADADSLHVRMADESWSLGDGGAAQTYINQDKLFDIIERSGVFRSALHRPRCIKHGSLCAQASGARAGRAARTAAGAGFRLAVLAR